MIEKLNPFHRPGYYPGSVIKPMMNWEIWWKLTCCFFGFHENVPLWGSWIGKGWGSMFRCWWCMKEYRPFEPDPEAIGEPPYECSIQKLTKEINAKIDDSKGEK